VSAGSKIEVKSYKYPVFFRRFAQETPCLIKITVDVLGGLGVLVVGTCVDFVGMFFGGRVKFILVFGLTGMFGLSLGVLGVTVGVVKVLTIDPSRRASPVMPGGGGELLGGELLGGELLGRELLGRELLGRELLGGELLGGELLGGGGENDILIY
jgi:hypothetical protein